MKDPCENCPKKKACDRSGSFCPKWEEYIFRWRNSTQMRITQYTEREPFILLRSDPTLVDRKREEKKDMIE